jgi:hypothetical protein
VPLTPTAPPSPTAPPAPSDTPAVEPAALFVVQQPDNNVVLVTVDGEVRPLTEAPASVYALTNLTGDVSQPQQVYALGPAGVQPLAFIQGVSYGVSAWTDPATGETRLAWDHFGTDTGLVSQIYVSDPGGSNVRELITESGSERVLRVVGWSADGQRLYYSKEPLGLGGYILFSGVSDLWVYDWATGAMSNPVPETATSIICLDDFTDPLALVAYHCDPGQVSVLDLNLGQTSAVVPPADIVGEVGVMGDARLNPAADRVAFALARGNPEDEQGWVAVADGLAGPGLLIATADPGDVFNVVDWLDDSTLILQSNAASPGLWLVNADGSGLRRLADGRWLGLLRPGG